MSIRHAERTITVADVAQRAGVSVGTVSNVLNDKPTVTSERRAKVLAAIQELGFTGSLLAKGMRTQRYPVVGLCVPYTTFSNFAALADAIEERASNASYELMQVLSRQDPLRELTRVQRLVAYKVGGILLIPSLEPGPVLDYLDLRRMPTVIINRPVPGEHRFDQVTVDHGGALERAARQLITWGHRHLLLLVQIPGLSVTQQRIAGLRSAVRQSGTDAKGTVMESGDDQRAFHARLARQLKKSRGTVVIASNSQIASWALQSFRRLGLDCPRDVSLLALDHPEWAPIVTPSLSYIQQPTREIADTAWTLLQERIGGATGPARQVLLDARIEFRESVAR
jgi:LacI family transcriptional regulator